MQLHQLTLRVGGKAKPLKAPKKEKKELDEDDIAYREKLKAGTHLPHPHWLCEGAPQDAIVRLMLS